MRTPTRIQRRRRRGWRMPAGAVYVGRPTIWGNPFAVSRSSDYHGLPGSWFVRGEDGTIHHPQLDTQASARQKAVDLYAAELHEGRSRRIGVELVRSELAGLDLVCWCPRDQACHADVLLAVANSPAPARPVGAQGISPAARAVPVPCPHCGAEVAVPAEAASGGDLSLARPTLTVSCAACGRPVEL